MNKLQVFNNPDFGTVRTLTEGDQVLFCGSDIAQALGYAVPRKALADHCKGVLKRNTLTNGGMQEMSFIPEPDLYRLVFRSKLPSAEKFTDWVAGEVLPAIRRTGQYKTPAKAMTDYQQMMAETRRHNVAVQTARLLDKIANQYDGAYRQVLQAHATKVLTGDFLLPLPKMEERTYSAGEIGEMLGISGNKVGCLTNRHNLKTQTYGAWFADKAKGMNKQVQTFRYFERVVPVLRGILEGGI